MWYHILINFAQSSIKLFRFSLNLTQIEVIYYIIFYNLQIIWLLLSIDLDT